MTTRSSFRAGPNATLNASEATSEGRPRQTVRLGYFDPDATEVFIAGTFNDWQPRNLPLTRDATGNWTVNITLPAGEYSYRLVVDGKWRDHPGAARLVPCPFGGNNAVVTVEQ